MFSIPVCPRTPALAGVGPDSHSDQGVTTLLGALCALCARSLGDAAPWLWCLARLSCVEYYRLTGHPVCSLVGAAAAAELPADHDGTGAENGNRHGDGSAALSSAVRRKIARVAEPRLKSPGSSRPWTQPEHADYWARQCRGTLTAAVCQRTCADPHTVAPHFVRVRVPGRRPVGRHRSALPSSGRSPDRRRRAVRRRRVPW